MKTSTHRSLRWLAYRVLRRVAIANISQISYSPIDNIPRTITPNGYEIRLCSSEQLRMYESQLEHAIPAQDFAMLGTGQAKCFAAFQSDSLAGLAWVAFGDIPGEMNHDGKPETGLPIHLAEDSAFIFNVLVLPAHRGQRLYAAIISKMADALQSSSIRTLVVTTEGSNQNALRAVEQMQFRKAGQASLFQLGPLSRASYPDLPGDIGFSIGRYAGDDSPIDSG